MKEMSITPWKKKAQLYLGKAGKMISLVSYLQPYLHKDGLKDVRSDLKLLMDYIYDIAKGNYKEYQASRLLIVLGALLYVLDPVDIVPDFIVGGFLDDATVIGWAITKVAQELEEYKNYKESQLID